MVDVLSYLKPYFEFDAFAVWFIAFSVAALFFKPLKIPSCTVPLIIIFGFLVRLGWLFFSSHQPNFSWHTESFIENDWINMNAVDITQGKWFLGPDGLPTGRRPIGYPLVLGVLYRIFGTDEWTAWIFHLVLFAATAFFVYAIAEKVFSKIAGILSLFFFSFYPVSVYSVKLITDEHLFLFLWYAGIFILLKKMSEGGSRFDWLSYGVIFGAAAMTRTYAIYMPVIIGLAYWVKKIPARKIIATVFLTAIVMQMINLPWVVRNYRAWGVPVLYAVAGHSIYNFTNPTAIPEMGSFPEKGEPGYSEQFDLTYKNSKNEGLIQRAANREIKNWFLRDPLAFSELAVAKLLYFMHWGDKKGVWPLWYQYTQGHYDSSRPLQPGTQAFLEKISYLAYYVFFHAWIFASLLMLGWRKKIQGVDGAAAGVLSACLLVWCLFHLIIMPDPKYRFPLEPLMMMFASFYFYFLNSFRNKVLALVLHKL